MSLGGGRVTSTYDRGFDAFDGGECLTWSYAALTYQHD